MSINTPIKTMLKDVLKQVMYDPYKHIQKKHDDDEEWSTVEYYDLLSDKELHDHIYEITDRDGSKFEIRFL